MIINVFIEAIYVRIQDQLSINTIYIKKKEERI
jgi:hypothetical protein